MTEFSYKNLLQDLYDSPGRGLEKTDLSKMFAISDAFSNPEKDFKSIHIAGTNGKGSVTYKIAKALSLSGFKIGIFTSPHLYCFRERIVVDEQKISEDESARGLKEVFTVCSRLGISLNFFEIVTVLAFNHFKQKKVDFAVIEVGLGGRLDATNIINPELSVITSISLDHVHILGSTLDEIALEKAGIIKADVPLVIGRHANIEAILRRASSLNSPVTVAEFRSGFYDVENQQIARAALEVLSKKWNIAPKNIKRGISCRPACRFEINGNVIFDVAHNPDAVQRLIEGFQIIYPNQKARFVLGMSIDKDLEASLAPIISFSTHIYLVEASGQKAAPVELLAEILQKNGFLYFSKEKNIGEAVKKGASEIHKNNEYLIICGSFFIMSEAQAALNDFRSSSAAADIARLNVI